MLMFVAANTEQVSVSYSYTALRCSEFPSPEPDMACQVAGRFYLGQLFPTGTGGM
jgi:hypothetical protein